MVLPPIVFTFGAFYFFQQSKAIKNNANERIQD